jgi:hypothetical protein
MDQVGNESWGTTAHDSLSYITPPLVDSGDLLLMMERAMQSESGIGDLTGRKKTKVEMCDFFCVDSTLSWTQT